MDTWIAIKFWMVGGELVIKVYFDDGEIRTFSIPSSIVVDMVEVLNGAKR